MNAKEFRIGNYVELLTGAIKRPSGIFKQIGSITPFECTLYDIDKPVASQIFDNYINLNELSEITLTEDWLIKFGFVYDENKGYSSDESERRIYSLKGFDLSIEENGDIRLWNECDDAFYSSPGKKFKYVHRLQNYYFEKTDKELD